MFGRLDGKTVVPSNDYVGDEGGFHQVGRDVIGDATISTVFLPVNHGFGDKDLWFETMIFGGEHGGYQERYETYEQAERGHVKAVLLVRKK